MAKSDASWLAQSFSTDDASSNGLRSSRFLSSTFECGLRSNARDLRAAVDCVEVFEPLRHSSVFGFSLSFGALDSRWRLPAGVTFWPPKLVDLAFLGILVLWLSGCGDAACCSLCVTAVRRLRPHRLAHRCEGVRALSFTASDCDWYSSGAKYARGPSALYRRLSGKTLESSRVIALRARKRACRKSKRRGV